MEKYFGRIFWEDFLGGFFGEDFFFERTVWRNSLFTLVSKLSYLNMKGIYVFVKILA